MRRKSSVRDYDGLFSCRAADLERVQEAVKASPYLSGAELSLDDVVVTCLIYPAIMKKSAYPLFPLMMKSFIGAMKFVKNV